MLGTVYLTLIELSSILYIVVKEVRLNNLRGNES